LRVILIFDAKNLQMWNHFFNFASLFGLRNFVINGYTIGCSNGGTPIIGTTMHPVSLR